MLALNFWFQFFKLFPINIIIITKPTPTFDCYIPQLSASPVSDWLCSSHWPWQRPHLTSVARQPGVLAAPPGLPWMPPVPSNRE